ncbi:hypothetical protein [Nannocystis sp.]|uniref:hypothetical protein n=1 Tax=Nannocystis sp. TaxID=1962667 RepID=UPI0024258875|nr:hypothetical protein [Nannocystis sp.]MBK7824513.1 hypothetical protein [Nannocystis sp.]MBK9753236.1 hypothetical protein [Nannocystis sp.]
MHGMKWVGWTASLVVSATLAGCGSGGGGSATASDGASTGDSGTTQGTQTSQATTSGGNSDSQTPTTSGSVSESVSETGTASDPTSASVSVTGTTTSDPTATGDTTGNITVSESGTSTGGDTTTGASDSSTGAVDSSSSGADDTTGGGCVPTPEICDDIDNDCDDQIDNVDVGKDGICDCLNIALIGNQGANPSAEFQLWLEAQGTQVDRISTMQNELLDKATLNKYDIIILDYLIRSYTAEEAMTTQTWVESGGGLMSMTGFTNAQFSADRPNSLIKPMGLSYNTSKGFFSGPVTQFVPHPITMGLTSISFYGGLFIDIVNDGVGVNKTIMTLPQGPVGVVQDRLAGRLFIFGDEWVEFDSEWKNIPQIKQFWVQVLSYLGPKESCQVPQ